MGQIIITSAAEMPKKLMENSAVAAVLSIEHPGVKAGERGYAPRLLDPEQMVLCFWDSEQPVNNGPHAEQVARGIEFVLQHLSQGDVIIHCNAGKARSAAIALGVLALVYPEKDEKTLIDMVVALRPIAAPNILVVEIADAICGRNGRLTQAVLDDAGITARRDEAQKARERQLRENPDLAKQLFPEKFPDATTGTPPPAPAAQQSPKGPR